MKKNLLKLKIENIAQNLFNTNQSYFNDIKEETNINQLSSDESTIKDSLSEFEEISKSIHQANHRNQRNKNSKLLKNSKHTSFQSEKNQSSLCTKMTSLTEHNSNIGTLEFNMNNDVNKQNNNKNKINEKENINIDNKNYKEIIDKNEIAKINKVNKYKINNLKYIYFDLLELFNSPKLQDHNYEDICKEIIDSIKLLSYKYINFIFSEDMDLLIKMFNNYMEIHKYLIIQIYFFISVIYLFDEKTLKNNYLLISYKSSLFYSLLNFENIMNILNTTFSSINDKLLNNIKSINKILLPILKIININIPTNSQLKEFISPSDIKNRNSNNNNINKESGISNLISSLKKNENLKTELNKLKQIENKIKEQIKIQIQLEEQEKEIFPILPLMNTKKYKFTIAIELDETLVHYCEEDDNYYAKVRFGSENFLKNLSSFFEIIVVSTSGKEYSNIIIDNLNKDNKCYVEHRLFIEDFTERQDLSKINRDFRKIIFVCHDYDFINAPKENIIVLKEFLGEEEDREIVKLYHELKQFIKSYENVKEDNFDIRNVIPEIIERINIIYENYEDLDDEEDDEK